MAKRRLATRRREAPEAAAQAKTTAFDPEARVDEIGALQDEAAALEEKLAKTQTAQRLVQLRAEMVEKTAQMREELSYGLEPDEKTELRGESYRARLGVCRKETTVPDVRAVAELLGDEFWEIAQVRIGDLNRYLTEKQLKQVVTERRKGDESRSLKVERIPTET